MALGEKGLSNINTALLNGIKMLKFSYASTTIRAVELLQF